MSTLVKIVIAGAVIILIAVFTLVYCAILSTH